MSISEAAALLADRAHSLLVELEAAHAVTRPDQPEHDILRRGIEGAEEAHLALLDLAARHGPDGGLAQSLSSIDHPTPMN